MSDEPRAQGPGLIEKLIRGALAGGAAGAVSGAPGGPTAAGVGAAGGALLGVARVARREIVPSADELVEEADTRATHDAARRVPELEEQVGRLAASSERLHEFANAVAAHLKQQREVRTGHRLAEVGRTLLRLVEDGEAEASAFDGDQNDAVVEAIRFSLDALRPEAVPMISRLAGRPVDHFFRGVCRVLVDLDLQDVEELSVLIARGARAIPGHVGPRKAPPPTPSNAIAAFDGARWEQQRLHTRAVSLTRSIDDTFWWGHEHEQRSGVRLRDDTPVLALLTAHRLASSPSEERLRQLIQLRDVPSERQRQRREEELTNDRRVLTIEIAALLDLHFVLSGERVRDPR